MTKQTTILGQLENFTEMLAEAGAFNTPLFPGSEDKFHGIEVSKASPVLGGVSEEFYVINIWSANGEIVFTALFFNENHIVVNGEEVTQDEALAIANKKMGGDIGDLVSDPASNVPAAVVAAIIELPTFQTKIDSAFEGADGMYRMALSKIHRIATDCYGNPRESIHYEIELYEVLGGNVLLEVTVEDGQCYIGSEQVDLGSIAIDAVHAMLDFQYGKKPLHRDAAFEEVALNPLAEAMAIAEFMGK